MSKKEFNTFTTLLLRNEYVDAERSLVVSAPVGATNEQIESALVAIKTGDLPNDWTRAIDGTDADSDYMSDDGGCITELEPVGDKELDSNSAFVVLGWNDNHTALQVLKVVEGMDESEVGND